MTYEEFKTTYTDTFNRMMSYKPNECGASYYAEKLAELAESNPEFELKLESEMA